MEKMRLKLLENMPVFGGASEGILEFLIGLAEIVTFTPGECLFREGDSGDYILILEAGQVVVTRNRDDHDFLLGKLHQGDCVGEMALLDPCPRSATITAITDVRAIRLTTLDLYRLHKKDLEQFTLFQGNMAREVCRRLRAADQRLFDCEMLAAHDDHAFSFHAT